MSNTLESPQNDVKYRDIEYLEKTGKSDKQKVLRATVDKIFQKKLKNEQNKTEKL